MARAEKAPPGEPGAGRFRVVDHGRPVETGLTKRAAEAQVDQRKALDRYRKITRTR